MTAETENQNQGREFGEVPRWMLVAIGIVALVVLVALINSFDTNHRIKALESSVNADIKSLKEASQQNTALLGKRLEQAEAVNAEVQGELGVVTERLKLTQGELARARQQAAQIREEYAEHLKEMESSIQTELAAKANSQDVESLNGSVSGVRSDLEATRNDLQLARGEMGTLIARNHTEIEQLRRLGERDYFEFTLEGKGSRRQVGNITVELRGTNSKKNQFAVALVVDDLRLEKKNRSVNEPIYFYVRGTRTPIELVINQVAKNKVVGYLSAPKDVRLASAS